MILNLWSVDQEGPVKIYGGGPQECSENIHQHCMYLALTVYVLYLFLFKGDHFEWYIVVRPDRFIGSPGPLYGGTENHATLA